MKGKILFLISLLVLAIFVAGCKEQAGEAIAAQKRFNAPGANPIVSPKVNPTGVLPTMNRTASVNRTLSIPANASASVNQSNISCADSDGGNNIWVKGTITAHTPTYGTQFVEEYCSNANRTSVPRGEYVEEFVCTPGDPTYAYTHVWMRCTNGCANGACLQQAAPTNNSSNATNPTGNQTNSSR
jgi:hypothetical protein